jgi:hypothetical protein
MFTYMYVHVVVGTTSLRPVRSLYNQWTAKCGQFTGLPSLAQKLLLFTRPPSICIIEEGRERPVRMPVGSGQGGHKDMSSILADQKSPRI